MKIMNKILLVAGAVLLLATSCIKETFPTNQATQEQVGASSSALKAMVSAIPAQMVQGYLVYGDQVYEFDMAYPGVMIMLDSAAGEIVDSGETGYDWYSYWSTPAYGLGATAPTSYIPWRTMYMFIKSTNDIIAAVNPETANAEQLTYLGQAHAVRAFCYLQLSQIYEYKAPTDPNVKAEYKPEGDITGLTVPIVTDKTTQEEAKANPRAKKEDMYAFILSDLTAAEKYLEGTASKSSLLPTLATTYGIRAKMHLALSEYGDAAKYANKAITAFGGSPLTQSQWEDPVNGFNNAGAASNSWMWYLAYSSETLGNLCNFVAHMSTEETWTSYGWAPGRGINKNLYEQIPDTDFRKHSWIDPEGLDYYSYKLNRDVFGDEKHVGPYSNLKFRPANGDYATYKVGGTSNVPLMRLEEMMLIKAEGLAMSGGIGEAKTVLNALIQTRNPAYSCDAIASPEDFQKEVILQKRIELWGEGVVFFDFKRLGYGILNGYEGTNVQGGYRYTVSGVAPWWNWTIPQSELNGNPVLQGINNPDPTSSVDEWVDPSETEQ